MAEITLADVVRELKAQNELTKQTDKDILSVSQKLAQILADQAAQNRIDAEKAYEDSKRQNKESVRARSDSGSSGSTGLIDGFLKGSGLSSIGGFISSMFGSIFKTGGLLAGKLLGAIGFGLGKMAIWGVAGGLIVNYFSDEIRNWLDPDGNGKMELLGFKWDANSPLFWGGLSIAAGMIATSLVGFVGGQILALGATGLAALFMKIPGLKNIGAAMDEYAAKKSAFRQPTRPVSKTPEPKITPEAKPVIESAPLATEKTLPKTQAQTEIRDYLKSGKQLPSNLKVTSNGRLMAETPSGFKFVGPEKFVETLKSSPSVKTPVADLPTAGKAARVLGTASKVLSKLSGPLAGISAAETANRTQQDPLTGAALGLATMPLQFIDSFLNLPAMGINYAGDKLGYNPNVPYSDLTGKALNTGLKALDLPTLDDRAREAQMALLPKKPTSIDDLMLPPRADATPAPTVMAPTTNNQTTVNNQQFENFYFGGGNSMDGNDTLMLNGP